ncbi:MAG TPA: ABC transporter substrate-binding protein [Stellaceae bacterium]|jgi:peptide/nickel transport system substrate-binding protein|nr:ABC transporter substrate-binding protein [Stellaceae bacterium]
MRKLLPLLAVVCLAALLPAAYGQVLELKETPSLEDAVKAGSLPPIADRLPANPLLVRPVEPGTPGGSLHLLMASTKDTRMMVVYGYTRLVVYTPDYTLQPDIAESVDVENGRAFTFHLRPGHKWSDGEPFTAEDFRYWFEDVASNKKLYTAGLPEQMLVDGKPPTFEVVDPETVRYTWAKPNPLFLPALAGPDPLYIYAPAHYMRQFNAKYTDEKTLDDLAKQNHVRNWAALHTKLFHPYHTDNPDLPVLDPWVLKTKPPADQFVFERNPYFHRIDPAGHQLPYIDKVALVIADSKIIPAKTGAGESDLQARYLRFDNYTFLKDAEEHNDYRVRLWRTAPGAQLALYPNLNVEDPTWRQLNRDVRFRRALSLAIDRHELNQAIYYGLAIEGQNTVLPESPLYDPAYRSAWAGYDPKQASRLLDEIGLTKRDSSGIRLLPDGQPLEIVIENAGESTEQSDALELIRDTWAEIGIHLFSKPSQLDIWRRRVYSGATMMSIDKGVENGLVTADMAPDDFVPTTQAQVQWPKWGQYLETKGKSGEPVDIADAQELQKLYKSWFGATDAVERAEIWHKILKIHADDVFSIGLVAGVPQPVVVSNKLHNVPEDGIFNWIPGAFFGYYHMDTFWLTPEGSNQASAAPPKG